MTVASDAAGQLIKWLSFDVGGGHEVAFGGTCPAFLNYVTGSEVSKILGTLSGTGKTIYLVNPNGIQIGKDAAINVGSLIASTKTLTDDNLADFNAALTALGGSVTGDVVNIGTPLDAMLVTKSTDGTITFTRPDNNKATTVDLTSGADNCTLIGKIDNIRTNLNGKYVLCQDITDPVTSSVGWNFAGELYGAGHSITLNINESSDNIGLFTQINGGKVQDLTLTGSVTGQSNVGALAGSVDGATTITDVTNQATVTITGDTEGVGGIVGAMSSGTLSGVTNEGAVTANNCNNVTVGGIAGAVISSATIENAYNAGTLSATGTNDGDTVAIGGIVGDVPSALTLNQVYNSGTSTSPIVGNGADKITYTFKAYYTGTRTGNNANEVALSATDITDPAKFVGWTGIDTTGTDSTSVWRIYKGHTAPMLKFSLTGVTLSAK